MERFHRLLATAARIAVLVLIAFSAAPARAEKRVALVIGNDRYVNLPALQKAANDAEAVGDTLTRIGFEVVRGRDLGRQAMIDKIAEFTARLEAGDTALFFYAGHGVAIGNVNYLVPSDAPAANVEASVRGASISEPDVLAEIQAKGARVAVLVLDACRDNPFPRTAGRSIGNTRGLVGANPARGVFVLYSAGAGQTALDRLEKNDPNRNSVFTRVFVEQLARPGLHLGDLAVEVRERVAEIAKRAKNDKDAPAPHEQTPAYYDQTIGGRVFLADRSGTVERPAPATPPPAAALDELTWNLLQSTSEIGTLRRFIEQFPASRRRAEAEQRIAVLENAGRLAALNTRQGTWQATGGEVSQQFGGSPYCTYRVTFKIPRLSVTLNERGEATATLSVNMIENGLGGCPHAPISPHQHKYSGVGKMEGDRVVLQMNAGPGNKPVALATFEGEIKNNRLSGTLILRRTDFGGNLAWVVRTRLQ